MTGIATALPKQAWLWIYHRTLLITGFSVAASVVATVVFMGTFSAGVNLAGLLIAIILPVCLGGPMVLMFTIGSQRMHFANSQLLRLATVDGLTGILNRRAFTAAVERQCATPHVRGVLLVIDADHFKSVNDRFGHDQGDEALVEIARALDRAVGRIGTVGRMGGEEFGVYLPNVGLATAQGVADDIRRAVAEIKFVPDGQDCPLAVSIGGAPHEKPICFRDLYREADARLYRAKQDGRDRVALPKAA